jgi:Arc-like DNA binding dprotein
MARKKAVPAQIKIRLPEALRRDLEREATKTGRTLNGEIVHRLTQPFVQADREAVAEAAVEKALGRLIERREWTDKEGRPAWSELRSNIKPAEQRGKK